MINKIYKIINNKFNRYFRFVFFLRYLLLIFFVALGLFLFIPKLFDYNNERELLKEHLFKNYGLELKKMGDIKFYSLPSPRLQIKEISANFYYDNQNLKTENLVIYPTFTSIYNLKNFNTRKIKLVNNNLNSDFKNFKSFSKKIISLKKKIIFKNLKIGIKDKENHIINFKIENYKNFGFKKNRINGEVFNKMFEIKFEDNLKNIKFSLLRAGISTTLNISENINESQFSGILKGNILRSKFKLDFLNDKGKINIKNLFFRDKKISFDSQGYLEFNPHFFIEMDSKIKTFNEEIIKDLNFVDLLNSKDLIKKINTKNKISYQSNNFGKKSIKNLNIDLNLAYGRLSVLKNLKVYNSDLNCNGSINLIEEFPIYYFNCSTKIPDKKIFLKNLNIKYKKKKEPLHINVAGNINILNKKIYFENLIINEETESSEDDLRFFKKSFENILFDEKFTDIFELPKIQKFILEIS